MNTWKMVGLPLTAVSAIGIVMGFMSTSAITACSSSKSNGGSSSSGGTTGGACPSPLPPGTFPPPDCLLSDQSTCGTPTTCKIDETQCGSASTCEPLADNSSKTTWDLRMRRIDIIAPKTLANPVVQNSVVTHGVDLNLKQCGELGDGSFSWLISFNSTTGQLKTGGAPPSADPIGTGYCFVNRPSPDGVQLGPVTVAMNKQADGSYNSGNIDSINIPIYYIPSPGATPQIIVLPINGAAVQGLKFSNNGNCIGSFDKTALDSQCGESTDTCTKWHTDASIAGYITLEQADKVHVPLVQNHTLCVLLTGDSAPNADGTCERDGSGKIKFTGDYCSTTKSAGGCGDAYWMAATFAAAAVKITDGAGVPDCNGGGGGNPDAGSSSDAAPE